MTVFDIYVGNRPDGSDQLEEGSGEPEALTPAFPPWRVGGWGLSSHPHFATRLSWGASGGLVTKEQIMQFVDELYGGDPDYADPTVRPYWFDRLVAVRAAVEALPSGTYTLVMTEF